MAIVAIDQGGTKTVALISDREGNILGTGTGFGACHFNNGIERAMAAVKLAVDGALEQARLSYQDIECISAGLAGANWPDEIRMLETEFTNRFGASDISVCNDVVVALRGGTESPDAVALCGGTGLNCAVKAAGRIVRVYNNYIDDMDQGGGSLGARALLAVFRCEIGIHPPTVMRETALEFFGLKTVDELLLAYQRKKLTKPLKDVVFLLFDAADRHDEAALNVLYDFGASLSRYVLAGARMYGLAGKPFDVVLSGGIFKAKNSLIMDVIGAKVHKECPNAVVVNARYEPVVGALVMGLEKLCGSLPETARVNCHRTAADVGLMRNTFDSRSDFFYNE